MLFAKVCVEELQVPTSIAMQKLLRNRYFRRKVRVIGQLLKIKPMKNPRGTACRLLQMVLLRVPF